MCIRLAKETDLKSIVEIYNQAIVTKRCTADTETFKTEDKRSWFHEHQSKDFPLYVYELEDKVVGYLYFSAYRPGRKAMRYTAEISYYLDNAYQGQGIGSKLMTFALKEAKAIGFKTLLAILLDFNKRSLKLLEKYGFSEWGRLVEIADFEGETCDHLYYGLKL